jgi:hypothetical protein
MFNFGFMLFLNLSRYDAPDIFLSKIQAKVEAFFQVCISYINLNKI